MKNKSVIEFLASSLDRRDEVPNQLLAKKIAAARDNNAVKELVDHLKNKNKGIQSDCIKVLYEIGVINATMISGYEETFIELLNNKNNRLIWGAMSALDQITTVSPSSIHKNLTPILEAAKKGSVITNDRAVYLLVKLAGHKKYSADALFHLKKLIATCPVNQLAMYAENTLEIIPDGEKKIFSKILIGRISDIKKESMHKRIDKVIKKLNTQ